MVRSLRQWEAGVRVIVLAAMMVLGACNVVAQSPSRGMPDWMGGYWLSCDEGQTAESWIGSGGDTLLGTNLSDSGFEFLRIGANAHGDIVYYSMPGGRSPPTEFALTAHAGQRVVFENPEHDFPKRIIYQRDGDTMTARIDGGESSDQSVEWRFRRVETDTQCATAADH